MNEGEHVEGVVYRLVAFFLEMRLGIYPERARIRTGNASACYWNLLRQIMLWMPSVLAMWRG